MTYRLNRKNRATQHGVHSFRASVVSICLTLIFLGACSSSSNTNQSDNQESGGIAGPLTDGNGASTSGITDSGSTDGSGGGASDTGAVQSGDGSTSATASGQVVVEQPTSVAPEQQTSDIGSDQTSFYFSYDESASTASRDLALTALSNGRKPDPELGRPYEFLNAENIGNASSETVGPFNVSMGLLASENGSIPVATDVTDSVYGLGVSIFGPTRTLEERRNVVLTVLLDISGSMDAQYGSETANGVTSLLDVAKVGLISMQQSLKAGDVINLVTFSREAQIVLEAHNPSDNSLQDTVTNIFTDGSTDIENGINLAYQVANRTYDSNKANRVVIITDAFVNTGVVDPVEIASHTVINGLEGIYFSGVGVGSRFNDSVLNTITEVGKGSYSAMITPADAQRIFTEGFSRFMNPAARDVRFQLTYPQELDQLKSFSEEISTVAEDVQTINFSYNSSQYFLELFSGPSQLALDGELRLDVTYKDENDQAQSAAFSKTVESILGKNGDEIRAAATVATLAQLINGSASCDNVLSSELYNSPVQYDVYTRYRQYIDRFCSL